MPSILERWELTERELTELVDENPSLRGMLLGYAAELKFRELIEAHPKVAFTTKHDDHDRKRKSDRVVTYEGIEFTCEVKSLQTNTVKKAGDTWVARTQVDASDRRKVEFPDGTTLDTTLLLKGDFDILAVNCFAFREEWDFIFALNRDLPTSEFRKYTPKQRQLLIKSLIEVSWPPQEPFYADVFPLLEILHTERTGGPSI